MNNLVLTTMGSESDLNKCANTVRANRKSCLHLHSAGSGHITHTVNCGKVAGIIKVGCKC